ncbi:hypothetical protein I4U23_004879 [Adineta vaga]|nr:hypothetical protein I4U23_004879 [Adineta vaga]
MSASKSNTISYTNNNCSPIICSSCGQSINIASNDEEYYKCQQCAHHHVCKKCLQSPVNKESNHQFKKILPTISKVQDSMTSTNSQPLSIFRNNDYLLFYITYCDHCLNVLYVNKQVIYTCDQCPSFVACEKCVNLVTTQHPDPLIRSSNRQVLARRTVDWFARQKTSNVNQREPITGWTKNDAEQIIQIENQFLQDYKRTKQQIEEIEWYGEKQRQEHEIRMAQMIADSQLRMLRMDIDSSNKMFDRLSDAASASYYRYHY